MTLHQQQQLPHLPISLTLSMLKLEKSTSSSSQHTPVYTVTESETSSESPGFTTQPRSSILSGEKNVLLSIDSDKTDEAELQGAVENASKLLREFNTSVVEYTSYADTKTIPGHYVIYWELLMKDLNNSPSDEVLNQCCLAMEESLNTVYRQGRVACNSIGPLEIRVVKNGTFEELMDYAISRGASINQYKVPRCVNFAPILELLDSRVMSRHFSPSLPQWTPERRR